MLHLWTGQYGRPALGLTNQVLCRTICLQRNLCKILSWQSPRDVINWANTSSVQQNTRYPFRNQPTITIPSGGCSWSKSRSIPHTTSANFMFFLFIRGFLGCLWGFWPVVQNPAGSKNKTLWPRWKANVLFTWNGGLSTTTLIQKCNVSIFPLKFFNLSLRTDSLFQQIIYKNQLTFILIDIVLDISNNKRMQSFDYVHDDQYTPKNKFTLLKLKYHS